MDKQTEHFLAGGGEMGERMRALDWSKTPLGPVEGWPQSLLSPLSMLLPSKAQIILFWGPEFVVFYNDAYRPVFGAKHPQALGQPGHVAWSEIWDNVLHSLLAGVVRTGEAFAGKDLLFTLERYGFVEETFFDVSYDPVREESGAVGGVFCIVTETTGRVVGERRLALLKDLAARNATARTAREACALAMQTLAAKPQDLPFALAYLGNELEGELQAATPGAEAALAAVEPRLVKELAIPGGKLVVGLNPQRPFDEQYASFLDLVAGQLATAISNAQAYEQERKRAEALAELDRAKTAFFSNVSHEFRTPLTLMLGHLDELMAKSERGLTAESQGLLAVAQRNGQRLLKLVNTLLDFARIEAGRARASYEPTDIGRLTGDLASNFRSACERAGLSLEVDCPRGLKPAYLDREMWEKVVLNLLSNAFKFTLKGGIAVRVREDAAAFRITVADTGIGIPDEALPRIFDRFHRVEGARGRSYEGSGIGLALVHELVRLHGGAIQVASTVGKGTGFTVSLPKGSAHLPAAMVKQPSELASTAVRADAYVSEALSWLPQAAAPATKETAAGQRVLLADDNADLRDYVKRLLSQQYEVEAVADGEAALAAARARKPDLIVSDVMMPRLDGFGLIHALRKDAALSDIPVVLLSARAGEEARIEGLEHGADAYLVKPFSARQLLVQVGALLQSAEARREVNQALREADRRKDEFLATLAHELRNPLAPIRNAVILLKDAAGDPEIAKRALDILERQVSHTIRLVDDLLDVARITRGTMALDKRMTTIAELVDSAIEIGRPHLDRGCQRLAVELPADPVALSADPVRMAQVVANLLHNATKFTPAGGRISIHARREGGQAVLSVRDDGRGIPGERLPQIFELFAHGRGDLYRDGGGLGIGLSLCRKLVEMHGGSIEARSRGLGQGSEFIVRLPIEETAGEARAAAAPTAGAPRRRVLVVDDNVDSAQTLGILLRRMGHEVQVAHDGRAALSAAATGRPQVVILDLGLPELDGYGVADRLRKDAGMKDVRLIALTGFGTERDRERSRAVGFDQHLVKPVDLDALRSALDG